MTKLLFFAGSSRKNSVNSKLAQAAAQLSQSFQPDKVFVTLVDLAEFDVPNFDGASASDAEVPEQVTKLRTLLQAHDGLFIGSDEYTGAYSAILRNLIGWLALTSGPEGTAFRNKPVVICGASARGVGSLRGHPALQQLLVTLGANVISQHIRLGTAKSAFQPDGKLTESVQKQLLENAVPNLVAAAR
jgi:NAD(P)H-dependent FMN reductase